MGPPLKWWTAIKAALVVCWETKRAFDHLGAHHFLMLFLKHDYQEMSPLTLYVANSTRSQSHTRLLFPSEGTALAPSILRAFMGEREMPPRLGVTSQLRGTFTCHFLLLGHCRAQLQSDQASSTLSPGNRGRSRGDLSRVAEGVCYTGI